ncbi:PDZ domain-containing protein [Alienimonas sp. DA493]|uniref:PDZ domain-containing protein n=1 Tax=Alienimonas sp. DA493 TaxID=3373605 RepID=UPI003754DF3D
MPRSAPRPGRGRSAFPAAALLIVAGSLSGGAAVGQDEPLLPGLPEGLAAPEESDDARTPQPPPQERVRENGIDARRFTPVPSSPGTNAPGSAAPGAAPEMRSRDDGARPSNGYQYDAPSGQVVPPAPVGPAPQLRPGLGGPGFDPDDSPVLLGVNGTDTVAGVLVTRVIPGTPADRAGLERGDRILTVAGYQVGVVNTPGGPRVYPLGVELARRLDARGEAALLVQDHRTGQITPVSVRPVPRYGPTNPPGYGGTPGGLYGRGGGSLYGPDTGFGTGVPPYGSDRFDPNRYDPNRYDGGLYDQNRYDAFEQNPLYRGGDPRR